MGSIPLADNTYAAMDYARPISNSENSPLLFIDPNIGILERLADSVSDVTACWHDVTRADDVDNSGCIPRTAIQLIVAATSSHRPNCDTD